MVDKAIMKWVQTCDKLSSCIDLLNSIGLSVCFFVGTADTRYLPKVPECLGMGSLEQLDHAGFRLQNACWAPG